MYMVVVWYHIDDATQMPAVEREQVRAAYESAGLPPIIVETLAFVSADLKHDNAFVRHVNDKFVLPYMQSLGNFNSVHALCTIRSRWEITDRPRGSPPHT